MVHRWSPIGTGLVLLPLVYPERGLEFVAASMHTDPFQIFNRDALVGTRVNYKSDSLGLFGNYFSQVATGVFSAVSKAMPKPVLLTEGCSDFVVPRVSSDGMQLAVVCNTHPDADRQRKKFIYLLDAKAKIPSKLTVC